MSGISGFNIGDNKIDYNAPKADIDSSSKIYSNHIELSNINSIASTKDDNSSGAESFDVLSSEAPDGCVPYVVKEGDTLESIARINNMDVESIKSYITVVNAEISTGDILYVPDREIKNPTIVIKGTSEGFTIEDNSNVETSNVDETKGNSDVGSPIIVGGGDVENENNSSGIVNGVNNVVAAMRNSGNQIYIESTDKLLSGQSDIDDSTLDGIGYSVYFIDHFEELIDLFIKSNDDDYKRKLLKPLMIALAMIQKEKFNLTFDDIIFENMYSPEIGFRFGGYSPSRNILVFNPEIFTDSYLENYAGNDLNRALVVFTDAIYHETTHAYQFEKLFTSSDFDFDILLFAMDYFSQRYSTDLFNANYYNFSYERDARDAAYAYNMRLYKNYPEMQQYLNNSDDFDYTLSDYIRRLPLNENETSYVGLVDLFLQKINEALQSEDDDEKSLALEILEKCPVIEQFFDFDAENNVLSFKDASYYHEILVGILSDIGNPEAPVRRYSLYAFMYSIYLSNYLCENDESYSLNIQNQSYDASIIEEVLNEIGSFEEFSARDSK